MESVRIVAMRERLQPYKCQYCDKTFNLQATCSKHEKIHKGEKPYKCQYCGKRFTDRTYFSFHKGMHATEKHHSSQDSVVTVETFSSSAYGMTHTGEIVHKCQFCEKTFRRKPDCTKHERFHTGEKPNKCNKRAIFNTNYLPLT